MVSKTEEDGARIAPSVKSLGTGEDGANIAPSAKFPGYQYVPKSRIGGKKAETANDAFIVQLMKN